MGFARAISAPKSGERSGGSDRRDTLVMSADTFTSGGYPHGLGGRPEANLHEWPVAFKNLTGLAMLQSRLFSDAGIPVPTFKFEN